MVIYASRVPPRPLAGQSLEVAGQQLEFGEAPLARCMFITVLLFSFNVYSVCNYCLLSVSIYDLYMPFPIVIGQQPPPPSPKLEQRVTGQQGRTLEQRVTGQQ